MTSCKFELNDKIQLEPSRARFAHIISSLFLIKTPYIKGLSYLQNKSREEICKRLVPKINGYMICSTIYGVKLLLDTNDWIGQHIFCFGEYEAGTISVLKKYVQEDDVFLDVGAYIGDIFMCCFQIYRSKRGSVCN